MWIGGGITYKCKRCKSVFSRDQVSNGCCPKCGRDSLVVRDISIVITTKNEERSIRKLLSSLVVQEPPIEILVVDAGSEDSTQKIVKRFEKSHKNVKLYVSEGRIGESFNYVINKANGEAISFIGADDRAHKDWIKYVRKALEKHDIVAGTCIMKGKKRYAELERVRVYHNGSDISYPGSNTTYKRAVLDKIGEFDSIFVTAEDIDLNYRATDAGYKIHFEEKAIVYRYARDNMKDFLRQGFWNGYGRKQLSLKHGKLWQSYPSPKMFFAQFTFWGLMRLMSGTLGYAFGGAYIRIKRN